MTLLNLRNTTEIFNRWKYHRKNYNKCETMPKQCSQNFARFKVSLLGFVETKIWNLHKIENYKKCNISFLWNIRINQEKIITNLKLQEYSQKYVFNKRVYVYLFSNINKYKLCLFVF